MSRNWHQIKEELDQKISELYDYGHAVAPICPSDLQKLLNMADKYANLRRLHCIAEAAKYAPKSVKKSQHVVDKSC